ncbi:MAG TPA: hypothetical protein VI168_11290 [Croceibacterium sp.]
MLTWAAVACNRGEITCGATTCRQQDFTLPFQPNNIPRDIAYQCGIAATKRYRFCTGGSAVSAQ